jgi:hypothetical protein
MMTEINIFEEFCRGGKSMEIYIDKLSHKLGTLFWLYDYLF